MENLFADFESELTPKKETPIADAFLEKQRRMIAQREAEVAKVLTPEQMEAREKRTRPVTHEESYPSAIQPSKQFDSMPLGMKESQERNGVRDHGLGIIKKGDFVWEDPKTKDRVIFKENPSGAFALATPDDLNDATKDLLNRKFPGAEYTGTGEKVLYKMGIDPYYAAASKDDQIMIIKQVTDEGSNVVAVYEGRDKKDHTFWEDVQMTAEYFNCQVDIEEDGTIILPKKQFNLPEELKGVTFEVPEATGFTAVPVQPEIKDNGQAGLFDTITEPKEFNKPTLSATDIQNIKSKSEDMFADFFDAIVSDKEEMVKHSPVPLTKKEHNALIQKNINTGINFKPSDEKSFDGSNQPDLHLDEVGLIHQLPAEPPADEIQGYGMLKKALQQSESPLHTMFIDSVNVIDQQLNSKWDHIYREHSTGALPTGNPHQIKIKVLGEPTAQKRHKSRQIPGVKFVQIYDPSASDKADFLSLIHQHAPAVPFAQALRVDVFFYFTRPAAHYGTGSKSGILKPNAPTWKISKPDRDNLDKFVMDSMNKIYWKDDSVVCAGEIIKKYDANPRTEIIITVL